MGNVVDPGTGFPGKDPDTAKYGTERIFVLFFLEDRGFNYFTVIN
jgi:hypothetical protein